MEQQQNKTKTQEYYKGYYKVHKNIMLTQARDWRALHKGQFVYFLINEDGNYIYCGEFFERPIIERLSLHMRGKSNLKMDANTLQEQYNLSLVCYKDFKKYNLNKQDLHFIENYFKSEYVNVLGKNKVKFNEDELSRTPKELISIALEEPYNEFNFDKYLN
jgi:hypothetical protein